MQRRCSRTRCRTPVLSHRKQMSCGHTRAIATVSGRVYTVMVKRVGGQVGRPRGWLTEGTYFQRGQMIRGRPGSRVWTRRSRWLVVELDLLDVHKCRLSKHCRSSVPMMVVVVVVVVTLATFRWWWHCGRLFYWHCSHLDSILDSIIMSY